MTELARDAAIGAAELLTHYSFDLGGFTVERLIDYWLREYPVSWLRSALVEALYQGRYKAVSVTQILTLWKRREQPLYHFNHEFERMVCGKFPRASITSSELPLSNRPPTRTSSQSSDRPSAATLLETREATKPSASEDKREADTTVDRSSPDTATEIESTDARLDNRTSEQETSEQETSEQGTLRSPGLGDRPIRALLPAAKSSVEPSPTSSPEVSPSDTSLAATPALSTPAESVEASCERTSTPTPIYPTDSEAKTESPIPTFKPGNAGLDATELVQWAGDRVSKHPIHQFVPAMGVSSFYTKLKAVVQSRDDYFTDLALAGDSIALQAQRERE